jgi:hypothetical protein
MADVRNDQALKKENAMAMKLDGIDKETIERALADPKSEERKQVAAALIAKHKAAVIEMLRDAAPVQK